MFKEFESAMAHKGKCTCKDTKETQDSTVNSSRQIDHNMWIIGDLQGELEDFFMFTGNCVDVDPKDMEHIKSKIESIVNIVINVKELLDKMEHKILNDRENIAYPLGQ